MSIFANKPKLICILFACEVLYTDALLSGALNSLLDPRGGEIRDILTPGQCLIPRYVPGVGVSVDLCIKAETN